MTKTTKWVGLICLTLLLSQGVHAKPASSPWADLQVRLAAEGWTQTLPGVFQRQLGPSKTEHVAYGREGLEWSLGQLAKRLELLLTEHDARPSDELARGIRELTALLERGEKELEGKEVGAAAAVSSLLAAPSCSISYGASADAYPLTSTQGVGAVASAHFSSTCGYIGDTYAEAYGSATLGGTTTTLFHQDPKTGSAISSSASVAVTGSSGNGDTCYSSAYAYAQSLGLGISWSTLDYNLLCPAPANLGVTISGTEYEYFTSAGCRTRTFTSSVSGGSGPYSYRWTLNGTQVGTHPFYSAWICNTPSSVLNFNLTVTDVNGIVGTDSHSVLVQYCPGGFCP